MALSVDIQKRIGNFELKVCFEAEEEVLALLGASGCGKSMTLKCIAGIEKPDSGRIVLNDKVLFDSEKRINLKPQKRNVGYLFQQYALFPNMTVWQNIECGLRDKTNAERIIKGMIRKMKLEGKENLKPASLSGGQQQRAALARILVNRPDVLLLDEPFSALDAHLRFQTEREVADLIAEYGKTTLLVSHDRDEVYRLSDRIAIMHNGLIESMGTRDQVFDDPATVNGARLTGCKNISAIEVMDDTHVYAKDWGVSFEIPSLHEMHDTEVPQAIGVRMKDIRLNHEHHPEQVNAFLCEVVDIAENLRTYTVSLMPDRFRSEMAMLVEVDKHIWKRFEDAEISITVPPERILLLKNSE